MADIGITQAANAYNKAMKNPAAMETPEAAKGSSFADLVGKSLGDAAATGYKGESTAKAALVNKASLNDMVMAVNNTELTLETVVAVRDRVLNAYQDIIKMPI